MPIPLPSEFFWIFCGMGGFPTPSWSRLGPNLESTRQYPEMTRHFWRWLVLRFSEIYVSAFLSRVDSDHLGVDSALRARKTDPLSLELNCLGVDSDYLGVDSALRPTLFDFQPFSPLSSELTLACLGVDSPNVGVNSNSSGVDSVTGSRIYFSVLLSVTPWSRLETVGSWLGKHRSRLETVGVNSVTGSEIHLLVLLSVLSRSRLIVYRSRLELMPEPLKHLESTRTLPESTRASDFGLN